MLDRLKRLPWGSLLQVAALTTVIITVGEVILVWAFQKSFIVRNLLNLLLDGPLGVLMPVAAAIGLGALAVYLLEQQFVRISINTSNLWALVPCLLLTLWIESLLSLPSLGLLSLSEPILIGIIVGIFWKGRPYWR
ncbi:MAG: peptide chain release factor 1 [Hormoscilla sp.]